MYTSGRYMANQHYVVMQAEPDEDGEPWAPAVLYKLNGSGMELTFVSQHTTWESAVRTMAQLSPKEGTES